MKTIIKSVSQEFCTIHTGDEVIDDLNLFLRECPAGPAGIFILVDENTEKFCLPFLLKNADTLRDSNVLVTKAGEKHKNIETAQELWKSMMSLGADRHSLLINLGGGTISDLGGFVASVFKRGITFINIPTTLMAQADAAIGGKTGINLREYKNQVGSFYLPAAVFIFPEFLETQDTDQLLSGFAEIIKHGLIKGGILWQQICSLDLRKAGNNKELAHILGRFSLKAASLKSEIVNKDYKEKKERKALNLGHTIGHAFESFALKDERELLHGHAVSLGLLCESYLSARVAGLREADLEKIVWIILSNYPLFSLDEKDIDRIMECLDHDKKNKGGKIIFTLLKEPGKVLPDQPCDNELIRDSFGYYCRLAKHFVMQ